MPKDSISGIKPFLEPLSIAVIGASPKTGAHAFNVIETLDLSGYRGQVYPVNPNYGEIHGRPCYPAISDITGDVDLAIIMVRREIAAGIVRQCADKGTRAAIIVTGGFADAADEEGRRLQRGVVEVARRGGVRILGPNTIGSANAFLNFSTSFVKPMDMRKLPIGVICQSGLFFGTIGRMQLVGKGLDLGNACDIDHAEALEYFENDPDIRVIVLHIEGIGDGERFREAARRAAMKKPVLALKAGRSELAAVAAQSHTGSLIGSDEVWDALLKQCGVIRAGDVNELGDLAQAFCRLPPMAGRRIGIITASGGIGIMSMDACARYNLEVAKLSPGTRERLNGMAPPWFSARNPVDIWPIMITSSLSLGETMRTVLHEVLGDPNVDGILLNTGAWFESFTPPMTEIIREAAEAFPTKPIAWCPYEGWLIDVHARELALKLESARSAVFSISDDALRALSRLADYSEFIRA